MTRTRPLVAVLFAATLAAPPALAELTAEQAASEQQACLQRVEGKVADPAAACTCMVEGLSETLSAADYDALAALLAGSATPEGEAARETARQVVAQCLGG